MGLPPSGFGLWGSVKEVTAIPGIREQSPVWHTLPSTLRGVARPAASSSLAPCREHGQDPSGKGPERGARVPSLRLASDTGGYLLLCASAVPAGGDSPSMPRLAYTALCRRWLKKRDLGFFFAPGEQHPPRTQEAAGTQPVAPSVFQHGGARALRCGFNALFKQQGSRGNFFSGLGLFLLLLGNCNVPASTSPPTVSPGSWGHPTVTQLQRVRSAPAAFTPSRGIWRMKRGEKSPRNAGNASPIYCWRPRWDPHCGTA